MSYDKSSRIKRQLNTALYDRLDRVPAFPWRYDGIRIMNEKFPFSIFWRYPLDYSSLVLLFIYTNIFFIWSKLFPSIVWFIHKKQLVLFWHVCTTAMPLVTIPTFICFMCSITSSVCLMGKIYINSVYISLSFGTSTSCHSFILKGDLPLL